MKKTNTIIKKITSLVLSLVFAISSFAVAGFSNSTAEVAKADGTLDVTYQFLSEYNLIQGQNSAGQWEWVGGRTDDSGYKYSVCLKGSGSYIKMPAGGGYVSLKSSFICFNSEDSINDMFVDDVYTIDFNFTLDSASTTGTVFTLSSGTADYLYLKSNGELYYIPSGASDYTKMGTTTILEGINYHFTVVSDGKRIIFYKNGKKVCSANATVDFPVSGARYVGLGWSDTHQTSLTGTYYSPRFRDYAISAETALSEYAPNLAYRYNEGATSYGDRNNVLDVQTKKTVTSYTGTDNTYDVTFSCMFNPGSSLNAGGDFCIFEVGEGGTTDGTKTYFNLQGNGKIFYCWGADSKPHYFDVNSNSFNTTLSANTWYHITVVVHWDAINLRYLVMVYLNGERKSSGTYTMTNYDEKYTVDKYFEEDRTVRLGGGNAHWTRDSGGYIDDFRIYGSKNVDPMDLYNEYVNEYVTENNTAATEKTALESAITAFENKVGDGNAYTNLSNAYNAYVKANRVLDAYNYGNLTPSEAATALNSARTDLVEKTAAMIVWTQYTGTQNVPIGLNNSGSSSNVLYASSTINWNEASNKSKKNWLGEIGFRILTDDVVVLYYDGSDSNAYFPVVLNLQRGGNNNDRYYNLVYAYLASGTGSGSSQPDGDTYLPDAKIQIKSPWRGYQSVWGSGLDWAQMWTNGSNQIGYERYVWNNANRVDYTSERYFGNLAYYVPVAATSENPYPDNSVNSRKLNFCLYGANYYNSNNDWGGNNFWSYQADADVYVVDYYQIVKRINDYKGVFAYVSNYKQGGLSDLATAFDSATSFNLSSYAGDSSAYTNATNAINTVVSNFSNVTPTFDSENYTNLKSKMDEYKSLYDSGFEGINNTYATYSIKRFVDAYEEAQTFMASLVDNSYSSKASEAYTVLSTLNTDISYLDPLFDFDKNYDYIGFYTDSATNKNIPTTLSYNDLYDLADEYVDTLGTGSQARTTTSLNALKDALDDLTYYNYSETERKNLGEVKDGAAVEAEVVALSKAVYDLDHLLSYETVDEEYADGDEFLQSIKGKEAQYKASSVQAILDTMDAAGSDVDDTPVERLDNAYSSSKQTAIDNRGRAITTAIDALEDEENTNYIDISTFTSAYNKITNLDKDAYNKNSTSISSAISGADAAVTYSTKSYDGGTINVVDDSVDQDDVNAAVTTMLTAITNSVRDYKIYTSGADISVSGKVGTYHNVNEEEKAEEGYDGYKGKGTYGVKLTFDAGDGNDDVAWYMSYDSSSTHRNEQYLGYGQRVQTAVSGNLHVRAVKKTNDAPNKLTINRTYSDNPTTHGITLITYTGSSYTLPEAPAIAYYEFQNYTFNGNTYSAGQTITVTNPNTVVRANYTRNVANSYTVKVSTSSGNGDVFNNSASYNTKIEGSETGAYGWVKVEGGKQTMFYVGSDLTYFVTDSIELKAVTSKPAGYTGVPTVYLRESGAVETATGEGKHKITINGNYVTDGYEVLEYGVLLGKVKAGGTITDEDVVVENAGTNVSNDYSILRAKATKTVGANQFSIAINTPASFTGAYKYRGYVMYKDSSNQIITVYTDVVDDSI